MDPKTMMAVSETEGGSFWFPTAGTQIAKKVDGLFYFILALSTFFFVLIVGLMLVFVVIYRRRPGYARKFAPDHNSTLEVVWSVIPAILLILIFFQGFTGFLDMRTPPAETY